MQTFVRLQHEHYIVALGAIGVILGAAALLVGASYGLSHIGLASLLALFAIFVAAALTLFRARVAALCLALEQCVPHGSTQSPGAEREIAAAVRHGALEIDSQVRHALDEMQRLHTLLDDAIGNLIGSFNALDELANRQRSWAQQDAAADLATRHRTKKVEAVDDCDAVVGFVAELQQHIEAAAVALQFHDMASQLMGHTRQRIEQARHLARGLNAIATRPEPATDLRVSHQTARSPTPHQTIGSLVVTARAITRSNPVAGTRAAGGAVELF